MYYEFNLSTPLPQAGEAPNISSIKFKAEVLNSLGITLHHVIYQTHKFLVPINAISLTSDQINAIQLIVDSHAYDSETEGFTFSQKTADLYSNFY